MLRIRLRQQGSRNHKTYRLVVMDAKKPRDGKYLDNLGWYAPQDEKTAELNEERLCYWIGKGAQMSEKVGSLVKAHAPAAHKMAVKA